MGHILWELNIEHAAPQNIIFHETKKYYFEKYLQYYMRNQSEYIKIVQSLWLLI